MESLAEEQEDKFGPFCNEMIMNQEGEKNEGLIFPNERTARTLTNSSREIRPTG